MERFSLIGLADFVNASGRSAYLSRCPPGNTTLANMVLKELGSMISNVSAAPGGFALLRLAVGRTCGDATASMSAPGPVIVLTVLVTLATLALASDVAERLALRTVAKATRSKSGGPVSINSGDIVRRRSKADLGGDHLSYNLSSSHTYEDDEEYDSDAHLIDSSQAPVFTPTKMELSENENTGGLVAHVNRHTPLGARVNPFLLVCSEFTRTLFIEGAP